jgi:dipeptidase
MLSCSCDTIVAMSDVTEDGSIIFGKNSDRQYNEPLSIRYIPSSINKINSKVKTTYIEIDEVEETYSCILFCPSNIFGAEMGFNNYGLVVGNEALFTKVESYSNGLTGMDLVRLILQRCKTSFEGKNELIRLLNQYDQGGNCGFTKEFYYQNSFLLVDSNEGWIIETIGKDYAAKRITNGIYTISNRISFGGIETFDEYSENLILNAISNGWCKSIEDFHFYRCYSGLSWKPNEFYNGFVKTYFSSSQIRQQRSNDLLNKNSSQIQIKDIFNILRDHQSSNNQNPTKGLTNIDICMHSSMGPIKLNQTTGSLVSVLFKSNEKLPIHYTTCSSLPCLAIYKPIWLDSSMIPPLFLLNSSDNLWWKYEIINRNISKFYRKLIHQIQFQRDLLENEILFKSNQLSWKNISNEQRNQFTCLAFQQVRLFIFDFL